VKQLVISIAVFAASAIAAAAEDQAIPLFNGKDLSGWTAVLEPADADPARTWSVADGLLKCTGKPQTIGDKGRKP